MTIKAQVNWIDGFQFVGRVGKGPAIVMDSTDGGSGPSPMQMVLMGVAGCTAIDVVVIMKKKRVELAKFQVNISGKTADEDPKRYTQIRIEYVLYGKGIRPRAVEQAIELSETKYCSAMASLNATIKHSYRIVDHH